MKPFERGRYVPFAWLGRIVPRAVRRFVGIRLPQDRIELRIELIETLQSGGACFRGQRRDRCDPLFEAVQIGVPTVDGAPRGTPYSFTVVEADVS